MGAQLTDRASLVTPERIPEPGGTGLSEVARDPLALPVSVTRRFRPVPAAELLWHLGDARIHGLAAFLGLGQRALRGGRQIGAGILRS